MRSLGHLDKTHNRKRDEFVLYVEAAARAVLLTKGQQHRWGRPECSRQVRCTCPSSL